ALQRSETDLQSARHEASKFHSVLPDLNTIRIGHRRLNEPFAYIEAQLFPMSIFLPRLEQLSAFFDDKKRTMLAESVVVEGIHQFPDPEDQDDARWKDTEPLCAAAVLRMLGLTSFSSTPQGLWQELQGYLRAPDSAVSTAMINALRRHLPEIFRPSLDLFS